MQRNKLYAHNDEQRILSNENLTDRHPILYPDVQEMIDFALDCTGLILGVLTDVNHATQYSNIDDWEGTLMLTRLGLKYQEYDFQQREKAFEAEMQRRLGEMIMANFNEHSLEMSIMELFQDEGYIYLNGEQIHRERSEVLLIDDLRKYLLNRYATEGLTPSEADSIILRLRSISGTIYEANKAVCKMICDGFIFNREDHTKKDLYIELIDFDEPEKTCSRSSINLKLKASTTSYAYLTGLSSSMVFLLLCLSSRAQSKKIQRSWTPILSSPCVIAVIFLNYSSIMPSSS